MLRSEVIGPRHSTVVDVPEPVPGENELLVRVTATGVCVSDVLPWRELGTPEAPIRLGHEVVGVVVQGPGPSPGTRVTGLASEGFSELVVMRSSEAVVVPPGIDPALAIGEPLACLVEALQRCPSPTGARVAVVGLGFMGLGLVQLVRGLEPLQLVGIDARKPARDRARTLGCDETYAPEAVPDAYLSSEPGSRPGDRRFDLVLEVTGNDAGLRTSGLLTRPLGTMCVVGYHHAGDAMVDPSMWAKGTTIVNGFCPDRRRKTEAMVRAVELIESGDFDYGPLVTHRLRGLQAVDTAFGLIESSDPDFVKAIVEL